MNRRLLFGLLAVLAVALVFRCPYLGLRPMHGDEAVHAMKFGALWEKGEYQYDPAEYHGPSLYYFTFGAAKLTGAPDFAHFSEARLRAVTVAFGIGLVLLVFLVADGLGRTAAVWAGMLTALSPAMVFYSRYYIHEIPLVFFAFLAMAAGWRYWRSGRVGWAVLAGIALGLMHATKETFVLSLAAGGVSLGLAVVWGRAMGEPRSGRSPSAGHVAAALLAWALVVGLLFSSFGTHWSGIADSFKTYLAWFDRASGASPHQHEWSFYLKRLAWFHAERGPVFTEAFILALAVVGLHCAIAGKGLAGGHRGFVRFLGFYTVILTGIYCAIGYKTPWCLLGFWHGMILLAGIGAASLWRAAGRKWVKCVLGAALGAGLIHLGVESWRANGEYCCARQNPYVYSQTSEDLLELVATVNRVIAASGNDPGIVVQVAAPEHDYWPLPWCLRNVKNAGYYDAMPAEFPSGKSIVILSTQFQPAAGSSLLSDADAGIRQLRPGVFLQLYVSRDIWGAYVK